MTRAQIEVIKDLVAFRCEPGSLVRPREFYPRRDNQDNAKRRMLGRLAELGLLAIETEGYRVKPELFETYRQWWRTTGFRDPEETNALLP